VILCPHMRLKSFGASVLTTVLFERLQVTLEYGEIRTTIVAQGASVEKNPCDSPHS